MGWWGWDGHGEEGLLRLRVSQQLGAVSVGDKCGGIHKAWASGYVEREEGIESHPRIGLHESRGIVTHLSHVRWDGRRCWKRPCANAGQITRGVADAREQNNTGWLLSVSLVQ